MRMKSRIGIVTAAGSGMGRAGALRFAQEGACVTVVDLNESAAHEVAEAIRTAGGRALALCGDLSDEKFSREIVGATVREFGGMDFLWNHVGHPSPAAFEELDLGDFDKAVSLNLRTVLATTSEAIPHLRRRGGGSVLFTASTSGLVGSPFSPVYSTVKFGIMGLSRSLAKRYGKENMRFNVVCPGSIDTPMLRVFVARPDQPGTQGKDVEALAAQRAGANPMGRVGKAEEVANAALFLLSDEASFVNGSHLSVDGGATA